MYLFISLFCSVFFGENRSFRKKCVVIFHTRRPSRRAGWRWVREQEHKSSPPPARFSRVYFMCWLPLPACQCLSRSLSLILSINNWENVHCPYQTKSYRGLFFSTQWCAFILNSGGSYRKHRQQTRRLKKQRPSSNKCPSWKTAKEQNRQRKQCSCNFVVGSGDSRCSTAVGCA